MRQADQFSFPISFTGDYPNNWAGYTFLQSTAQNALHPGIDWNWGAGEEDYGKPIQLIANGICVHQSRENGIGYGIISVFKHELTETLYKFVKTRYNIDTRNLYSFYAHQKDEIIDEGKEYLRGDLIGYVGKSGVEISHLHQELYKPIPGTQWRYWPTLSQGWTQEKLKQYYIDTYDFIVNQPSVSNNDDLSKCKEEVQREIKFKNDTFQELVETRNELEASQSENTSHQNFIKQLAITLSTSPDTAQILGQITKLLAEEDQLRTCTKNLENKNLSEASCQTEKVQLQEQVNNCLLQNKTIVGQLEETKNDSTKTAAEFQNTISKITIDLDKCNASKSYEPLLELFGLVVCKRK